MINISIVIPVYNTPKDLFQRCIDSLNVQTYPYAELIVVNDGSTSDIKNFIHMVGEHIPRCTIIDILNQGVSEARNIGVKKCTSEYVMFVDADDVVLPFMLEEAAIIAEKTHADIIYGRIADIRNENEFIIPKQNEKLVFEFIDTEKKRQQLLNHLIDCTEKKYSTKGARLNPGPFAKLIKHNIAITTPFKKGLKIGEDELWNLQIAKKANQMVVAKTCWYYYIDYDNSATHRFWSEGVEDFIRWSKCLHEEMLGEEFEVALKRRDINIMIQIMKNYYAHRQYPYASSRVNRDFKEFEKKNSYILNCNAKIIRKIGFKYAVKLAMLKYSKYPVTGYKMLRKFKYYIKRIK